MITIDGREVVVERVLFKDPITVEPDCKLSIRSDGEEVEASIIHPPKDERLKLLWEELNFTEDMVRATPQEVFDEAASISNGCKIYENGNVTYLMRFYPDQPCMDIGYPVAVWISEAATVEDIHTAILHPNCRTLKNVGQVPTDLPNISSEVLIRKYKALVGDYLPEADFLVQSNNFARQETIMNISDNVSLYQIVKEPHGMRVINIKSRKV